MIRNLSITSVEATPLQLPLKYPLKVATGTYECLTPVLIRLDTNAGVSGISEVQSSVSYDRIGVQPYRGVVQILEETFAPLLLGQNPFQVEVIWSKLDRVRGHDWVKAGIDGALYDIMGRVLDVPASFLLGGPCRTEVPVEGVGYGIPVVAPDKVARIAREAVDRGFTQLELKVGDEDPALDIERVRLTRQAVGSGPSIKVDFNKGGRPWAVIKTILAMEAYGIEWVEQPLDYWDLDGLARIRRAIHTPLVVDETVNSPMEMFRVASLGAADAIHLKPTIKGGLTGARHIAAVAEAAGIDIIPGTLCPTGVGMGIVHTFTASCREIARGIHGSPLDLLADDIVTEPIPPGSPTVRFSDKPGLGFDLDMGKVEAYRVR